MKVQVHVKAVLAAQLDDSVARAQRGIFHLQNITCAWAARFSPIRVHPKTVIHWNADEIEAQDRDHLEVVFRNLDRSFFPDPRLEQVEEIEAAPAGKSVLGEGFATRHCPCRGAER